MHAAQLTIVVSSLRATITCSPSHNLTLSCSLPPSFPLQFRTLSRDDLEKRKAAAEVMKYIYFALFALLLVVAAFCIVSMNTRREKAATALKLFEEAAAAAGMGGGENAAGDAAAGAAGAEQAGAAPDTEL